MEEQLGIKRILNGKDTTYSNVKLINGDKIRLSQGRNFINNPFSGETLEVFVEIKNDKIYRLEKIDTLTADNKIVKEEWLIGENGGGLNFTTTDLQGRLVHFYGQVFSPGKPYVNYTDTSVDSLGNAFTEWGETREPAGARKKN